ncbi:MAG: hypothetical protein M3P39_06685 [Actinomycetota bacterium]|nr:hypothetical protein [Actinomycetota bacterium]
MRCVAPVALVAALALLPAACGGGEDEPPAGEPSLADVAAGRVAPRDEVRLTGRGYPMGEAGFVLAAGEAAVFVDAAPSEALKVEPGERLEVTGRVRRQRGGTAVQIESALEGDDVAGLQQPVLRDALERAPVGRGRPYVEPTGIRGEG